MNQIVDLIIERKRIGKTYGVILIPEGLIEFIPEANGLIDELNSIISTGDFDDSKIVNFKSAWDRLPTNIQKQLLLDRDSTGYIQVICC